MHTIFKRIIVIPMSILIIIGVILMWWMLDGYNKVNSITIRIEEGESELVEFKHLGLIPGETCEYTIKIKGEMEFVMRLDFIEHDDPDQTNLKDFAFVKIISGGETILDELLADAFDHEELVLPIDFSKNQNTELTIIYYLPIEVGNEAKNAVADFDLQIKASEE